MTFGGWKDDFMLVVNQSIMRGGNTVEQGTQRLLFEMSRGKVRHGHTSRSDQRKNLRERKMCPSLCDVHLRLSS